MLVVHCRHCRVRSQNGPLVIISVRQWHRCRLISWSSAALWFFMAGISKPRTICHNPSSLNNIQYTNKGICYFHRNSVWEKIRRLEDGNEAINPSTRNSFYFWLIQNFVKKDEDRQQLRKEIICFYFTNFWIKIQIQW